MQVPEGSLRRQPVILMSWHLPFMSERPGAHWVQRPVTALNVRQQPE
jgi:hypothetical protein